MAAESLEPRRLLAAGDLVSTFGSGGIVSLDFDTQPVQSVFRVAQTSDDKLLLAGFSSTLDSSATFDYLARLTADGTLDNSFDSDGILALPESGAAGLVQDIIPLPENQFLVVRAGDSAGSVARYSEAGVLDTTFGTAGFLTFSGYTPHVARFDSGEIVAVGNNNESPTEGAPIQIFTADGALRSSNGSADVAGLFSFTTFDVSDVIVDAAGDIFVAGAVRSSGAGPDPVPSSASVARLNNDLTIDSAWGIGGVASRNFDPTDVFSITNAVIDPAGRILLGINEDDGVNDLIRFDEQGTLDIDELFRFSVPAGFSLANEVARLLVQSDSKPVLAGYFEQDDSGQSDADTGLARFTEDGSPDSDFGGSPAEGQAGFDLGTDHDFVSDFVITQDGDAVAVGRRFITLPSLNYDGIVFKVDLGDITGPPDPPDPPDPPAFDSFDGGVLRLAGTAADDVITITSSGSGLVATRTSSAGDASATYDLSEVTGIIVEALGGNDSVIVSVATPSTLLGGDGNDTLIGGGGNDAIDGEAGDDVLVSQAGSDVLTGGAGTDTADYSARTGPLFLSLNGEADDGEAGEAGNLAQDIERILGGAGADSIVLEAAGAAARSVLGNAGNDTLVGGAGFNLLDGGDGNDSITGGAETDSLIGGAGDDTINGGGGDDEIFGNAGNDQLTGGEGNDTVQGDTGADTFFAGLGDDEIFGGDSDASEDVADFSAAAGGVRVDLFDDADNVSGSVGGTVAEVSVVNGSSFDDTLIGSVAPETLVGGDGNDLLIAGSSGDLLVGDAGDDTLTSGAGTDTLVGGEGSDTASYAGRTDALTLLPGAGAVSGAEGENDTLEADIESVIGGDGGNTITASTDNGPMTLTGGDGPDLLTLTGSGGGALFGGAGDDSLVGSSGNDSLYGQAGDDSLVGGAGMDSLRGHGGADTLDGGDDNDKLVPGRTGGEGDVVTGGGGFDLVDYRESTSDLILVRGDGLGRTPSGTPSADINEDVELAYTGSGNDELLGFIRARGGDGNDLLQAPVSAAEPGPAAMFGEGGDDVIDGSGFNDFLDGGDGSDTLGGGGGDDEYAPGAGADDLSDVEGTNALIYADSEEGVTIDLTSLPDGFNVTNVLGSPFADTIIGNNDANYLNGGGGEDTIRGAGGRDVLVGGDGLDRLEGGDNSDLLFGFTEADGNDDFIDAYFGGGGADMALGAPDESGEALERFFTRLDDLLVNL